MKPFEGVVAVHVFVGESTDDRAGRWRRAMPDVLRVEVIVATPPQLRAVARLDAEILPALLVHERYGGLLEPGGSKVLSTQGEPGMPPYVVTTPVYTAQGSFVRRGRSRELQWVRALPPRDPEDELAWVFSEALRAVREFNATSEHAIGRLGFSAQVLAWKEEPEVAARALVRALAEE